MYIANSFGDYISIYQLAETWIIRNLDDKIITHIKRWLHFHQGANLTHLKHLVNKFKLGLQLISENINTEN